MCVSHKFSKCTTQKPKWFPAQILMCFEIYNRLLKMLGNGPKAFSELLQAKQARPPDTKLDQPIMMRWTRQHSGRILESVQVDSSARPMSPPVTHKTPLDVSLQNHNYNQWHSVMHCSSQSQKKKTFLKSQNKDSNGVIFLVGRGLTTNPNVWATESIVACLCSIQKNQQVSFFFFLNEPQ